MARGARQPKNPNQREYFFASCPRGLEPVLATELRELGAGEIAALGGGVKFSGDFALCYRANLQSRLASRILWQVGTGNYQNENDLYRIAHALSWSDWFSPKCSIRVNVTAIKSSAASLNFIALKIKDAVCDHMRARTGRRPNIDTRNPDMSIHAHLTDRTVTVYLDTTGAPLFKRGLRVATGEAPLRENLAAGILKLAGWSPGIPLLDPMCGSATILIEAAMMALEIPPGRGRRFAFEKLANFDATLWRNIGAHKPISASNELAIFGSDKSREVIQAARKNLTAAGLERWIDLRHENVLDVTAPAPGGIIVTNPPYGVRIGEQQDLAEFYPRLGDVLKKRFAGWRVYLLSADMRLPKLIHLAVSKRTPLFNGALDCRLFEYNMIEGSMRKTKEPKVDVSL